MGRREELRCFSHSVARYLTEAGGGKNFDTENFESGRLDFCKT